MYGIQGIQGIQVRRVRFDLRISLIGIASLAAVLSIGSGAVAQEAAQEASSERRSPAADLPTIADQFEDTFFRFDANFYQNRRFPRNATWLFGPFTDNQISGDGRATNRLYHELLRQQNESDPTIRTADLPNPYNSSLLSDSLYTEEPVPSATTSTFSQFNPPVAPAAPAAVEVPVESPIPALW